MDTVAFIKTSISKKRDLILSFAIEDRRWPNGIRTLILLRCPAHEDVFEESERGISVSIEGEEQDKSDLAGNLLTQCTLDPSAKRLRLKTPHHSCNLDLDKINPQMLDEMWQFLSKMNFDHKATLQCL